MRLAFMLSMPGVSSWNGKWTGEGKCYAIVRTTGRADLAGRSFGHNFGDGWFASVGVEVVPAAEARKLRRKSDGFCGYDWMVDSIIDHGEIRI